MTHRAAMWVAALLASAAVAPAMASAQDTDFLTLERAVRATSPSSVVRVELRDERRLTGELLAADTVGIELSTSGGTAVLVPLADVSRYWERGRAVRGATITLGVIGAGAGALLGALLASTCETCSADHSTADGALQGGLVVGGLGVLVGGVLGAAIPRWRLRWEDHDAEAAAPVVVTSVPASESPRARREIGELTLQLAGGNGRVELDPTLSDPLEARGVDRAMFGVIATLSFRAGRFGLGPELLHMTGDPDVTALTGIVRLDLAGPDARVAPYLLAGVGGYQWEEEELLTVPLGVGTSFGAGHRWRTEVRWHQLVHHGSIRRPELLTISAGRRLAW